MSILTPGADPLTAISIIPRGRSLGMTMSCPEKDRHTYRLQEVEASILSAMGGRVAEELRYGEDISTGASDDLGRATKLVKQMIYA